MGVRGKADQAIERLSERRREVLALLAKGLTNEEIAGVLGISEGTVRTHVTAILSALDVTNRTEAASLFVAWKASPTQVSEVLARPAITVLPLRPRDPEPRTALVAMGVSHDLAALFARWCWFPVIAGTATADPATIGGSDLELGRQLGARFLVAGTFALDTATCRIDVRLDDTETAYCLWTERYEVGREELFAIQDELCAAIVATVYPLLIARVHVELDRAVRPEDAGAWELAHDGMRLYARREQGSSQAARDRFVRALEREPGLTLAHYGLGLCGYDAVLNQWEPADQARTLLLESARRCVELAPHGAEGHFLLARYYQTLGDHASTLRSLEVAIARNPSFGAAHALCAQSLQLSGRSDEALVRMKHAMRIGPRSFVAGLATLHFSRCEYAEALEAAERAVALNPLYPFARLLAAAAAWWLGERQRAEQHARLARAEHPRFEPARFARTFGTEVDPVHRFSHALAMLDLAS